MTKQITNVAAVVRSSAEGIETKLAEGESVVFAHCRAMIDAGVKLADITNGGQYLQELNDGVLIGWQGAEFFAAYMEAKGKGSVKLQGKIKNKDTGRLVSVEFTRREWQQKLASRVKKVRDRFVEFIEPDANGDKAGKASKGGKGGKKGSQAGNASTNLLGMIDKGIASWLVRLDKVREAQKADGKIVGPDAKLKDIAVDDLRAKLDAARKVAIEINK